MTATTGFIIAAAGLLLAVLIMLLPPLLRHPNTSAQTLSRREANLGIFRDQLSELERERDEGSLGEADFIQAREELQRRLLEEVSDESALPVQHKGKKTALALLVTLPLAAGIGYALLGTPEALNPAAHTSARMDTQQIDDLLNKLAERLKANPDDSKGWIMLARSYKALGRYNEAAEAYTHGGNLLEENPALLADYAEVLLQLNGGNFEGKPSKLISQALKLNPDEPQALFLAGAAAIERKQIASGIEYWKRLLRQLNPNSEEARALTTAIDKANENLAQKGSKAPAQARLPAETISGTVVLSGTLAKQVRPDDLLFVFARPDEGSRMPLAVIRARVAELPLTFRLDDSQALPGGQTISSQKTVTLEARIAKSSMAQSASGDLFGIAAKVKPGSKNISLHIDQVQP